MNKINFVAVALVVLIGVMILCANNGIFGVDEATVDANFESTGCIYIEGESNYYSSITYTKGFTKYFYCGENGQTIMLNEKIQPIEEYNQIALHNHTPYDIRDLTHKICINSESKFMDINSNQCKVVIEDFDVSDEFGFAHIYLKDGSIKLCWIINNKDEFDNLYFYNVVDETGCGINMNDVNKTHISVVMK